MRGTTASAATEAFTIIGSFAPSAGLHSRRRAGGRGFIGEARDLTRAQLSPFSARKIGEFDRTDRKSFQVDHRHPQFLEHPADLSLHPLADPNLECRGAIATSIDLKQLGGGGLSVQIV